MMDAALKDAIDTIDRLSRMLEAECKMTRELQRRLEEKDHPSIDPISYCADLRHQARMARATTLKEINDSVRTLMEDLGLTIKEPSA